jgi:large subunit ribosomal protein L23
MSILDRFRKQKPEQKKEEIKKPSVKVVRKEEKTVTATKKVAKKEFSETAFRNLKHPLITEKATILTTEKNQYVFAVAPQAGKIEIKKAIQDLYGVKVQKVNIINVSGKKRRLGRHEGWHSGYKKAIVFLAPEEKIEIIAR